MSSFIKTFSLFVFSIGFLVPSQARADEEKLGLEDVLSNVRQQYPPLLAAMTQQDIATGRVREAVGAFDPILTATLNLRIANFYDGDYGEVLYSKPLLESGGEIYGGYRLSSGFLADYERKYRTANLGEAVVGAKIPLLKNRSFDKRRAKLAKAQLDQELIKPEILKLHLAFLRTARLSYYEWLAAGHSLAVTEQLLAIAKDRAIALEAQIKEGAIAPILQIDNQGLVVKRELATIKAQRKFDASAITLSLFHRNVETGEPIIATRDELPDSFPALLLLEELTLVSDRGRAIFRRPEVRQIDLYLKKNRVDLRLANNNLKPNLDFAIELNQALGDGRDSDIDATEINALLKYSIAIGQNEAKGRREAVDAYYRELLIKQKYAREKIFADATDAFSAVQAAYQMLDRSDLNVQLAEKLQVAENAKFENGASDLLALQIREQKTFDAKLTQIEAVATYFKKLADYYAAVARDAPSHLTPITPR